MVRFSQLKDGVGINSEEITFQQYKMYTEQKENFIDRSFHSNKFYLATVIILILLMLFTKGLSFAFGITSTLVFSFIGTAICIFWSINVDSYNLLIKVK